MLQLPIARSASTLARSSDARLVLTLIIYHQLELVYSDLLYYVDFGLQVFLAISV